MTDYAVLDISRQERIGISEAILCEGKTPQQIAGIIASADGRLPSVLLTRLSEQTFRVLPASVRASIDYDAASCTGIWGYLRAPGQNASVAVVSGGTSDFGVAREAVRTLAFHGEAADEIYDVGVAGLWRLMERLDQIRRRWVVIVAAGMDGALFIVVAGLVSGLVIALPISRGYGVGSGGYAALHTALCSCAPGVAVVNIDNGYGAACVALRALQMMRRFGKNGPPAP
jgi:pyridinium-3,5-biscarboxylic acid mononucleotide synthase